MKIGQRLEAIHTHADFESLLKVLRTLKNAGGEAVLAGGSVRDSLLGHKPKDLDLATSLPPDQVEKLFARTIAVGKAFGTIVVNEGGVNFEVTTFRSDGAYLDGRRPSQVVFTGMKEDALRRDFTINALFYDPLMETVFDFVGGQKDLGEKRLRTVGSAIERFQEDHLRMLRAVRFVAQLGFELDHEALLAIGKLKNEISKVSIERILAEIKKLLSSTYLIAGLNVLQSSGMAQSFWPEIQSLDTKTLKSFGAFNSWENTFAAIAWLVKMPLARLKDWKASRESIQRVSDQINAVNVLLDPKSRLVDRVQALGGEHYADILVLTAGLLALESKNNVLDQWMSEFLRVAGPDGKLPAPLLNGQDLISKGFSPGIEMGKTLKAVYEAQLEGRISTKDQALGFLSSRLVP